MATREDSRRYLENWQDEIDSAAEYRAMAESARWSAPVGFGFREGTPGVERSLRSPSLLGVLAMLVIEDLAGGARERLDGAGAELVALSHRLHAAQRA